MKHRGQLKSGIPAICEDNFQWSYDSTMLHCYPGLVVFLKVEKYIFQLILRFVTPKQLYNLFFCTKFIVDVMYVYSKQVYKTNLMVV